MNKTTRNANGTAGKIRRIICDTILLFLAVMLFYGGMLGVLTLMTTQSHANGVDEGLCDAREAPQKLVMLEDGRHIPVPVIVSDALYTDSHGATAYGWEINEAIRLMMLECGSYTVSEADKREHCAVLCKQLLYTQTVGGYNGWGTTLWGVMHAGNSYLETAPRIWNDEAEPTDQIAAIFWDVWVNGYFTDFRVQSYRSKYHFAEGVWAKNAYSIGNSYYSRNIWQDFSMFDLDENGVLGYPAEWWDAQD